MKNSQQQREKIELYESHIIVLQAEVNSLKLNVNVNSKSAQTHRQQASQSISSSIASTNALNVNGNGNYNSPHPRYNNKPFVSRITWHRRNELEVGDNIDYRYVRELHLLL